MKKTYDVSDGPSQDFFVSPVIRVADSRIVETERVACAPVV